MASSKQPVVAAAATPSKKKKKGVGAAGGKTPAKGKGKKKASSGSSRTPAAATSSDAADNSTSGSKRRCTQDGGCGVDEEGQAGDSSPTKPKRTKKTKKKKGGPENKKKKGGPENKGLSQPLMQVVGNPDFFVQIFVEEGWLPKMRDIIALSSTCKALAPLRAPWDSLSIDLKQAQKTLRYPNRWLRRLASPACAGLKCLLIARPVTAEMNHELANAFQSGHLSNLQELTLSGYYDRDLQAFKPLVQATETSLLPSLRLLFLDRYRVGSKGWDIVDEVLKNDKAVEKKGKAMGSIPSKRMLIESVRVHSSLAYLTSLNLRETGIRTATLENWIKTLDRHKSGLQELSLIGNKIKSDYLAKSISAGAFPALRVLHLDEIALTSQVAARIVDGLAKRCDGLKVLVLGNSHGSRWKMRNSTSTGTELVNALSRAAVGGPMNGDGLVGLQTLVLAWVGLPTEAVKGLTGCLFGGKSEGGEGLMQGFHFASELPDGTISSSVPALRRDEHYFPALESFGFTQQSNLRDGSALTRSLPFLKRVLRACLARGITDVDLSRNGLRSIDVVEMIQFLNEDPTIAHNLRALPSDLKFHVDLTQVVRSHEYSYPAWEKGKSEVNNFVNHVRWSAPACVHKNLAVEWGQTQLNK